MAGANYEVNISVDIQQALNKLNTLEAKIKSFNTAMAGGGPGGRRPGRMAAENINALTRAQDKRFRLLQKIDRLEEKGANVAKLRAGLAKLTETQGRRQFGTFNQMARLLDRQVKLEQAKLRTQKEQSKVVADQLNKAKRLGGARSPIRGAVTMPGSPAQLAAAARAGGPVSSIRGSVNQPGSPAFIEAQQRAIDRAARVGGARSSIRGSINEPGSPAFIEAQTRELQRVARLGGATSPIKGSTEIPGSPAFIDAQAKERDQALRRSQQIGGARSSVRGSRNTPGSPAFIQAQQAELARVARQGGARNPIMGSPDIPGSPAFIDAQARERDQALRRAARIGGPRSPIQGTETMPGSPRALAAGRRRQGLRGRAIGRRFSDVALGGGFPLLFGGGPGAVLGGAVGGATGGGLGAQIALSALGQTFDKVLVSAMNLGKALSDVNPDVQRLAEAAGFAGTETAMLLEKIEKYGDKAQAAQLATKLLATQIGQDGVTALKTFGDDAVKLGNALSVIFSQVLANIAKAAGPLLQGLARFANEGALIGGFKERKGGLTGPEQLAQDILNQGAFTGSGSGLVGNLGESKLRQRAAALNIVGLDVKSDQAMREFARSTAVASQQRFQQPVLKEIETVAGGIQTPKEASAAKAAARRLQASQQRIALLGVETQKQKDITAFKDRIAKLELDGDKMSATRLQGEQRLLDIAAQKERAILRISQELPLQQQLAERTAINEKFAAQEAEARAQTERELNVLQRERDQQHMDALKQHIEMQYQLNTAIQQQLQLADSISQVMGQGLTQAFDLLIDGAQNWGMALRDIAANVLRDIARQLIQIYVIEQAIGFMKGLLSPGIAGGQVPIGHGGGVVDSPVGKLGTFGPNYGFPVRPMAKGGPVMGRHPYLVGERGPELFMPGHSGKIVPNHMIDLGGKFLPFHPLFLALMSGAGDFGGNRQAFIDHFRGMYGAQPRANGGPVSAGSKYLVGERGPEMFVPRGGGGGGMISNIVVNVDSSGSRAEGTGDDQKRLGEAIGVAVRQELIKQQRPGGLLA